MIDPLQTWDTDALRMRLLEPLPNTPTQSLCVFLSKRADTLDAFAGAVFQTLRTRHPEDPMISLNLEEMLADRMGPARLIWQRSVDAKTSWERLLHSLRELIPENQTTRSWLERMTPLDDAAIEVVVNALNAGDFGSAHTLLTRKVRKRSEVRNEELDRIENSHAERALSETDLLELLDVILRHPPQSSTVRWVIFSGLESVLSDSSPNAQRLRAALRSFMRAARSWKRVSLVFSCWERATDALFDFDPAFLQFTHNPSPTPPPQVPLQAHTPALVRRLGAFLGMSFQERSDLDAYISMRDDRLAALIWPSSRVDPSEWVISVAPRIARIFIGGRLALLVPSWAWGKEHEVSRKALQSAIPHLSWVPVSHCEAALFSQLQLDPEAEQGFNAFLQRVRNAWDPKDPD